KESVSGQNTNVCSTNRFQTLLELDSDIDFPLFNIERVQNSNKTKLENSHINTSKKNPNRNSSINCEVPEIIFTPSTERPIDTYSLSINEGKPCGDDQINDQTNDH